MTEHMTWSSDLNTNIHIIDAQHKKILDYINALHDAEQSKDRAVIRGVMDALVDYTISHFAYEESMLENAGYQFLKPHQKVHELFISKINNYIARFEAGEDVTRELFNMLKGWLAGHIKSEDADYVDLVIDTQEQLHKAAKKGLMSRFMKALF